MENVFLSLHFRPTLLLLRIIIAAELAFVSGLGIGVGIGGGIWVGGGGPSSSSSSLAQAYVALQAWKSAISEDPLKILETWVGSNVCDYKGVFCVQPEQGFGLIGSGDPVVAGIDLNRANLVGTLVGELSLLKDLSILHLNSNGFTGSVPESLRYLSFLKELDLSNNRFSGQFPISTLYIPSLIYLDLRFNNFYGPIPADIFNKKLDAILLNNNQFSGEIPSNLGNSPSSVINLSNNRFTGSIPFSLGYMGPRLREILFINNQLTGCIPQGVGVWQNLQVLDVSFNSLIGRLPDSISCLSGIEVLNLEHNQLSGEIPDLICGLSRLMNLNVAFNFFSGFSQTCSKLPFRNAGFDISSNCIAGMVMQRPQPECFVIPGGGINCLRMPVAKPIVCGALFDSQKTSHSIPSSPP